MREYSFPLIRFLYPLVSLLCVFYGTSGYRLSVYTVWKFLCDISLFSFLSSWYVSVFAFVSGSVFLGCFVCWGAFRFLFGICFPLSLRSLFPLSAFRYSCVLVYVAWGSYLFLIPLSVHVLSICISSLFARYRNAVSRVWFSPGGSPFSGGSFFLYRQFP